MTKTEPLVITRGVVNGSPEEVLFPETKYSFSAD